jgi:hypothetical protein
MTRFRLRRRSTHQKVFRPQLEELGARILPATSLLSIPSFNTQEPPAATAVITTGQVDASGFYANTFGPSDDGSTRAVPLGFDINFNGHTQNAVFLNMNGNLTFDASQSEYRGFPLVNSPLEIIAPFFADVDTENGGQVFYGTGTVDGHAAWAATWLNVAAFQTNQGSNSHENSDEASTPLDKFQVVLISRPDTGAGNFDIEFNYGSIQWDSADYTFEGGPFPARIGFSNGTAIPSSPGINNSDTSDAVNSGDTFGQAITHNSGLTNVLTDLGNTSQLTSSFELPGSGQEGALLDSNANGLIHNSLNSDVQGRYLFEVRNGPQFTLTTPAPLNLNSFLPTQTVSFTDIDAGPWNVSIDYFLVQGQTNTPVSHTALTGLTTQSFTLGGEYQFTQEGNYVVDVTVTNNLGQQTEESIPVTVLPSATPPLASTTKTLQPGDNTVQLSSDPTQGTLSIPGATGNESVTFARYSPAAFSSVPNTGTVDVFEIRITNLSPTQQVTLEYTPSGPAPYTLYQVTSHGLVQVQNAVFTPDPAHPGELLVTFPPGTDFTQTVFAIAAGNTTTTSATITPATAQANTTSSATTDAQVGNAVAVTFLSSRNLSANVAITQTTQGLSANAVPQIGGVSTSTSGPGSGGGGEDDNEDDLPWWWLDQAPLAPKKADTPKKDVKPVAPEEQGSEESSIDRTQPGLSFGEPAAIVAAMQDSVRLPALANDEVFPLPTPLIQEQDGDQSRSAAALAFLPLIVGPACKPRERSRTRPAHQTSH